MNLGHHAPRILIGCIAALIASTAISLPPVANFLFGFLLIVVVLSSWVALRRHDRRLCEACMSSMPLDASAVADRFTRRFKFAHKFENKAVTIGYIVVLLGSNVFLLFSYGVVLWAAVQLSLIYMVLAYSSHRKFAPWCPLCDGGGEDRVQTIDPVPMGAQ